MKKLFYIAFLIALSFSGYGQICGGIDQWDLKTMTDVYANNVKLTPIKTTVAELRKIPAPIKCLSRTEEELKTYQVDCKIVDYRLEEDGDYHLVLIDLKDTTLTIVAEIPDYTCPSVAQSKQASKYKKARDEFEKHKAPNKKVKDGIYRVVGVCFFDKIHGQLGISDNGIELHPVLKFAKIK